MTKKKLFAFVLVSLAAVFSVLTFLPRERTPEPELDNRCSLFCEGLLCVSKDRKWGYVNEKGRVVIPLQFDYAEPFEENGTAEVSIDGERKWINTKGKFVERPEETEPKETGDVIWYKTNYQGVTVFGLKDKDGNILIEPGNSNGIQHVGRFTENGLAAVIYPRTGGGYVNKKGELVISARFNTVRNFSENGLAAVKYGSKWGYIDSTGEYVIELQFEDARSFASNGLAAVKVDGQWGVINKNGKFVIEPTIDNWMSDFGSDGLALVVDEDRFRFINRKGKTIHLLPEKIFLHYTFGYNDGTLGWACRRNGSEWFIFDRKGKILISSDQYDTLYSRDDSDYGNGIM